MIQKMGSLKDLVDKLPLGGMFPGGLPTDVNLDDKELVRVQAIIQSMTRFEKGDLYALIREPRRVDRIAKGSGTKPEAVTELVQKFLFMKQMMGGPGQNLGMHRQDPGMKQAAMAKQHEEDDGRRRRDVPGMPGMGGFMPWACPGWRRLPGHARHGRFPGMPGMMWDGHAGDGRPRGPQHDQDEDAQRQTERNAKKGQRKRERDARKKGRK